MDNVTRSELLAKSEVQEAIAELRRNARRALPDAGFAQREEAVLAIFNEAMRSLLEEDLRAIVEGFGARTTTYDHYELDFRMGDRGAMSSTS